jgi:two-component system CAI-1 autoinducer sensor kinase/phosphatase CqsS
MSLEAASPAKRPQFANSASVGVPVGLPKQNSRTQSVLSARLRRWLSRQHQATLDAYQRFDRITFSIGLIGALGMPLYHVVWQDLFPQPYENLTLRVIGAVLCLALASKDIWPSTWRKFAPFLWYTTLAYCLPFFFTFMLLMNGGNAVWSVSWLCAFLLLMVVANWSALIALTVVGATGAFIAYGLEERPAADFTHLIDLAPVLFFALIVGSLFIYRQGVSREARFRTTHAIAHGVSREVKAPLHAIGATVNTLKQYLPVLLDTHALARTQGLSVQELPSAQRESIKLAATRIQSELHRISASLQLLVDNSQESDFRALPRATISIRECVRRTITHYPFASDAQRRLIKWRGGDDFAVLANETLTIRILTNLIKATLAGISRLGRGEVALRLETSPSGNRVVAQLVGWSIPVRMIGRVFEEDSFLEAGGGTGSGLFFAKRAMRSLGGKAWCEALPGTHTNFILEFPRAPKAPRVWIHQD